MPLALTTVTSGTAIDWLALKSYCAQIEYYLNENIPSGDLKTSAAWCGSTRIFKPDFHTGPAAFVRMVSGELHYRRRSGDADQRSVHHPEVNTPIVAGTGGRYVPVEGMSVSFNVPESITTGAAPNHRVLTSMSWYAHECGGAGTPDELADHCSDFVLFVNGATIPATACDLYTASGGAGYLYFGAAKQYSLFYPASVTPIGQNHIGLRIRMYSKTTGGGTDDWRHVFIWNRTAKFRWYSR